MAGRLGAWRAAAVIAATKTEVARRMERGVLMVEDRARRLVNRGNPDGTNPSRPGEPPKKVTGGLQSKMTHRVEVQATEVVGYVGNTSDQARRLELGFSGTDSRGRVYDQAARPYLRPAVTDTKQALAKLFGAS